MGMPERKSQNDVWPLIEPAFWWIRLRHGFDMRNAQDSVAVTRGSHVAVLLIHESEDREAAFADVERLRDANLLNELSREAQAAKQWTAALRN
jgi:hypothetical protein